MTENSLICNLIKTDINWKESLAAKGISVKESGNLAIFCYGVACNFADPIVQEARGIIIDLKKKEVVCWPFRKFGNYGESYVDDINWSTARVQEKVDGSIVKLWFDHERQEWRWSSNGMIDAGEARALSGGCSLLDLIKQADNYSDIDYAELNEYCTYIFELVSPMQQIVVKYPYTSLYHTGTRSNLTGEEIYCSIDVKRPKEFPLHSLIECIEAAKALNAGNDEVKQEGFVVVDDNWHRIKVKSPDYIYAHHLVQNNVYTKKRLLPLVISDSEVLRDMLKASSDSEVYIRYYQYQFAILKKNIRISIAKARAMYEELSHDRKATAAAIADDPYKYFAFKAIGNDKSPDGIISDIPENVFMKWIQDYTE